MTSFPLNLQCKLPRVGLALIGIGFSSVLGAPAALSQIQLDSATTEITATLGQQCVLSFSQTEYSPAQTSATTFGQLFSGALQIQTVTATPVQLATEPLTVLSDPSDGATGLFEVTYPGTGTQLFATNTQASPPITISTPGIVNKDMNVFISAPDGVPGEYRASHTVFCLLSP